MEVGRSIEVCHKLAYSLAETSPFWKRLATKEALLVHNRSSTSIWDCIPSSYFWNEAKLGVSSAWWPLSKGDNNGRALMIETAKRLSLNRDVISRHSFLQLFCVASYRRFNSITVFLACMCDQTKPVGEINQVNKILALLCASHYCSLKKNSLLFSCTPLLCKLNSVSRQVYFSPLLFDILFIMLWTRWTF